MDEKVILAASMSSLPEAGCCLRPLGSFSSDEWQFGSRKSNLVPSCVSDTDGAVFMLCPLHVAGIVYLANPSCSSL